MSNLFAKTCFECGKKQNILYEGRCDGCVVEQFPPIKEIKPMNFKIDNVTKQICYNNHYYDFSSLVELLPEIVEKHIVINEPYTIKELEILNPTVQGHKLVFDIEVDCDLKNE